MNKNELAIEVSKRVRIPLKEVISVIDCTLDVIGVTLINDEPFITNKLGTFYLKRYKQTIGYDPYHKTHILKPEGKRLKFEPSASIRKAIREKHDKGVVEVIDKPYLCRITK